MAADTMLTEPQPNGSRFWFVLNSLIVVGLVCAAGYFVCTDEEAADVVWGGIKGLFVFFTTPFILETSLALVAIIVVGLINRWRLLQEGDGWVEMEVEDSADTPSSPEVTEKLDR